MPQKSHVPGRWALPVTQNKKQPGPSFVFSAGVRARVIRFSLKVSQFNAACLEERDSGKEISNSVVCDRTQLQPSPETEAEKPST